MIASFNLINFVGISINHLKSKTDITLEDNNQLWDMFTDKHLTAVTEQFFNHVLKLLNIFCHVIDEITPVQPQNKPVLPNLPAAAALSPIKRRKSDLGERTKVMSPAKSSEKEEKAEKKADIMRSNFMGYFAGSLHYLKIYELLKTSYSNYKVSFNNFPLT